MASWPFLAKFLNGDEFKEYIVIGYESQQPLVARSLAIR